MRISEIDGAHGFPRDIVILTDELQQVLHDISKRSIVNLFQPKLAQRYDRRFIHSVNREA